MKSLFSTFTTLVLAIWLGCSGMPDTPDLHNPLDPLDPDYIPPETSITSGPEEGAIVDTHMVSFTWEGSENVVKYAYRLSGSDSPDWDTTRATSITFSYLDEGAHLFEVKGIYATGEDDDTPASRSFTIDDIQGPAIRFAPRSLSVATGNTFDVEVILEEVDSVKGVRAFIQFAPSLIRLEQGMIYDDAASLLKQNGGIVIPFLSYDSAAGTITIEVATATGNPPGVSGTGAIALVTFTAVQRGNTPISFIVPTELRDSDNVKIPQLEKVKARVEVK